jgi:hypothetical protein
MVVRVHRARHVPGDNQGSLMEFAKVNRRVQGSNIDPARSYCVMHDSWMLARAFCFVRSGDNHRGG